MKVEFPEAAPSQAAALSDLAIESKGHWGYSRDQLEVWRKDLRIDGAYIVAHLVRSILVDGELVGFFAIKREKDGSILDHLWLLSKAIGRGVGKRAFQKIVDDCHRLGIEAFTIVSDPHAEGFYLKQGALRVGEVQSIPQKRMLPKPSYRTKGTQQPKRSGERSSRGTPRETSMSWKRDWNVGQDRFGLSKIGSAEIAKVEPKQRAYPASTRHLAFWPSRITSSLGRRKES